MAGVLADTAGFMAVLPEPPRFGTGDTGSKTAVARTSASSDNLLDFQEMM